jgi:multiple sugar transport system permease protein
MGIAAMTSPGSHLQKWRWGWLFLFLALHGGPSHGAEKQVLRVWFTWMLEETPGRLAAMAEFEKQNPSWEVRVSRITGLTQFNPQDQKLLCAIAGGDPPEVVLQDRFTIGGWAARDAFEPLDDLIERDWKAGVPLAVTASHYYPACWQEAAYKGQVFGIPTATDCRALYWNRDLIEAAAGNPGWKLFDEEGKPRPPYTWEELETHNKFLVRRDSRGVLTSVGLLPDQGNCYLYMFGFLNGGEFMSRDNRHCTLNDPRIVEALQFMCNLYKPFSSSGDDRIEGKQNAARFVQSFQGGINFPFLEGQVALWVDVDGFLSVAARYKPDFRFGVIPMPYPKDKEPVTWSGGFALVIPRGVGGEKKEMAWKFIKWMCSPEAHTLMSAHQRDYNRSKGRMAIPTMSANRIANEKVLHEVILPDPDLPSNLKEQVQKFYDLLPKSRFRPVTPVGQLLWNKQFDAVDQAAFGNVTPQAILDRYTAEVNADLDRINTDLPPLDTRIPIFFAAAGIVALLGFLVWYLVRKGPKGQVGKQEMIWGYLFLSPWLVGFVLFMAGPILVSLFLSFTQYDVLHSPKWVGLMNYKALAGLHVEITSWAPWRWQWTVHDPLFWKSMWNTAFMLISIPLTMSLGLGIALLLQQEIRWMATYRTLFYLPSIVPFVASSVLWLFVLKPESGLLNLGIESFLPLQGPDWLAGQSTAKPAIVIMLLWAAGGSMIVWLAGLKGIGPHYYESAAIDGAGFFRKLFSITLPLLTPYILYNLIMGTISILQIFAQAMVMTYGGPANSTLFYAYYLFNNAFFWFRMGIASAMAWILLVITLILALIQLRSSDSWVHYEGDES